MNHEIFAMATQAGPASAVSTRPSGTVTFLFSDIEGSTVRWEAAPDAMAPALARHDTLMREAIAAHAGYVFKTIGDAFCAAFGTPDAAIAAALDAQRALAGEDFSAVRDLPVRMAIHAGTCDERDGDYFGSVVNRVARLLEIGHGGQILLSSAAAALLQSRLRADCSLRNLGAHRLKDLARPEEVWQLVAPPLRDAFPPLRSLEVITNNLPPQLTTFVGREETVEEVKALVEQSRLVTLIGTGGIGKTRCAIQAGAALLGQFADGVWLAELAPIADPALVTNVIARTLGIRESPNCPLIDDILAHLKRKTVLLILDNCEHVIDEVRRTASAVLQSCPNLRVLATSREALNVAGEHLYRMPSLSVPPGSGKLPAQEALRFGAIALFADRASSAAMGFSLKDESARYVTEICRRLDGIPLAIELAAARIKVVSPQQLARMLDERFRVLTGGDRDALPRHQTMRALIDWSYDLLSEREQKLFRTLSIFAGGFTLESASAVFGDAETDEFATLELLSSLVDKSLVHTEDVEDGVRYSLLESTRQYARDRLTELGEFPDVAQAHARAFLQLGEQLDASRPTTSDHVWYYRVDLELENFRAALSWAFSPQGDVVLGQRLAAAIRMAWWNTPAEGQRWLQKAHTAVTAQTPARVLAMLDLTEAEMASSLLQHRPARDAGERAAELFREIGDSLHAAQAERLLGHALVVLGDFERGEALLRQALEVARELKAQRIIAVTLQNLASARMLSDDITGARALDAEALALHKAIGADRSAATLLAHLAEVEYRAGDAIAALGYATEALAAHRKLGSTRTIAILLVNISAYLIALERYDEAREYAREGLTMSREAELLVMFAAQLDNIAAIGAKAPAQSEVRARNCIRAAQLLGYLAAHGSDLAPSERREHAGTVDILRDSLSEDDLKKYMGEGSAWNEDRAVAEAMTL